MLMLANIVRGTFCLTGESLFYKEYVTLVSQDYVLTNVVFCEIKNIEYQFTFKTSKVDIDIEFSLVFTYEYVNINNPTDKSYRIIVENGKKRIQLSEDSFGISFQEYSLKLKYFNELKDLKCNIDIDSISSKLTISVFGTIENFLISENTIDTSSIIISEKEKLITQIQNIDNIPAYPDETPTSKDNSLINSITKIESLLFDMMKEGNLLYETKVNMNEISSKMEKELNYYKNRASKYENEYHSIFEELKKKNIDINKLHKQLQQRNLELYTLNQKKEYLESELISIADNNSNLKKDIVQEEQKKEVNLLRRIKSAMSIIK